MGTRLFVGGLSFNTDDAGLREAFEPHGEVVEAKVILDRETGRSRGFGFVNFSTEESAQAAVRSMDGVNLDGRTIRVNEAQERGGGGGPRRGPPRGGSGGREPQVFSRGRPQGGGGGYRGGGGGGGRPGPGGGGRPGPGGGGRPGGYRSDSGNRGGGGGYGGPARRPQAPRIDSDIPFENEFDERKRKDFSKKKRTRKERDPEKPPPRAPRNPNRRASGRSWRDLDHDDLDDE